MRTFVRAHPASAWVSSLAAVVLISGCTASPEPSTPAAPSVPATPSSAVASPSATASGSEASAFGVDPAVVAKVNTLCAAGPGKTVEELPDVAIPAVRWEGVSVPEQRAGTKTVPALNVPAADVPAATAKAGCLVTFDAPAGCLPAATISAGWIPGYRIEGYSFPEGNGDTVTVEPLEREAIVTPEVSVEQRCQVETSGEHVRAVYRRAIYRRAVYQRAGYRRAAHRRAVYSDGESVQAVAIPAQSVPAVALPAANLPAASLPARQVTKEVSANEGDSVVAYTAADAVLFEYNKSVLRRSATKTLDAVLADARAKGFTGKVRVEGHTDNTGDKAANQRLSEARAQPWRITWSRRGSLPTASP